MNSKFGLVIQVERQDEVFLDQGVNMSLFLLSSVVVP